MNAKQAKLLRADDDLLKRLTKFIALQAFRNTELENLHCGKAPSSKTGDFSDVRVVSPFGEIPWTELSRFNNAEMKVLMIDVVNHTYAMMVALFCVPDALLEELLDDLRKRDPQPEWDEPKSPFDPDKIRQLMDG